MLILIIIWEASEMAETGQKLFPGKDDPSGSPKARRRRIRVHTVIGLVLTETAGRRVED